MNDNNSIKNIKPSTKSGFKQGYFKPINESKYIGGGPIIFRSSWERKFAIYCDNHPSIVEWSSEPFYIKYHNIYDNKLHKYYPDFYFKIINETNNTEKYIVEVKPSSHLVKPEIPLKKTQKAIKNYNYLLKQYLTNYSKIKALNEFAQQKGYKVLLLTEKNWIIK